MKYSFLLSPARQPTPRLEPRHGHINHPTQPWDESKLEINALQGLTAAHRGMLERGGDSAGTVHVQYQTGKGAAATGTECAGTGSDHVRPHQGAPEIQGAGKGLQLLLHRERFEMRARGHPVLPGPAGAWRVPAEPWAGASRWDRRRGAIAAWHAN